MAYKYFNWPMTRLFSFSQAKFYTDLPNHIEHMLHRVGTTFSAGSI